MRWVTLIEPGDFLFNLYFSVKFFILKTKRTIIFTIGLYMSSSVIIYRPNHHYSFFSSHLYVFFAVTIILL